MHTHINSIPTDFCMWTSLWKISRICYWTDGLTFLISTMNYWKPIKEPGTIFKTHINFFIYFIQFLEFDCHHCAFHRRRIYSCTCNPIHAVNTHVRAGISTEHIYLPDAVGSSSHSNRGAVNGFSGSFKTTSVLSSFGIKT